MLFALSHIKFTHKQKQNEKVKEELPECFEVPKIIVDPTNDASYFIFGDNNDSRCWKHDCISQTSEQLASGVPIAIGPRNYNSKLDYEPAYFQLKNDNNETSTYIILYGGEESGYHIYDLQTQTWDENSCMLHQKLRNEHIDRYSEYAFGEGLCLITDLFNANKIHIIGGRRTYHKYGYMQFSHTTLHNPNLGFYVFIIFIV